MENGEDDSSNSDTDQENKKIDHSSVGHRRCCCLPNWLCTALCCFGHERGDLRRQTPNAVPVSLESESGDDDESEIEEEDDSSDSDTDQSNTNIDHSSVGRRCGCLPNWLCNALCCLGHERGHIRSQAPNAVPVSLESESGDDDESESEEEDDSSNSDTDQNNNNIDHGSVGHRCCCLPHWFCTALCCFGHERGDIHGQARNAIPVPLEPESGGDEESESEEEVEEPWPAELPLRTEDLAYLKQEQGGDEEKEEEIDDDDGRMYTGFGASNYDAEAHSAAGIRKLIKKAKGKVTPPPPPPPPTNSR